MNSPKTSRSSRSIKEYGGHRPHKSMQTKLESLKNSLTSIKLNLDDLSQKKMNRTDAPSAPNETRNDVIIPPNLQSEELHQQIFSNQDGKTLSFNNT